MTDLKKIIAATAGVAAATGVAGVAAVRRRRNQNGAEPPVYRVKPNGDSWVVDSADGSTGATEHETKRQALSKGRTLARSHAPSRLVIHRADGTIQRQHSYETDL